MIIAGLMAVLGTAVGRGCRGCTRDLALCCAAAGRLIRESSAARDRSREREARGCHCESEVPRSAASAMRSSVMAAQARCA